MPMSIMLPQSMSGLTGKAVNRIITRYHASRPASLPADTQDQLTVEKSFRCDVVRLGNLQRHYGVETRTETLRRLVLLDAGNSAAPAQRPAQSRPAQTCTPQMQGSGLPEKWNPEKESLEAYVRRTTR